MNPKFWELAYLSEKENNSVVSYILSKITKMGYQMKPVKVDEFNLLWDEIPQKWRFSNTELFMAGVDSIFVPKPEYKDRIVKGLSSGRN
jgi:hypothetical protein